MFEGGGLAFFFLLPLLRSDDLLAPLLGPEDTDGADAVGGTLPEDTTVLVC